jgi:AcrR family transcriptional regulator
VSTPADTRQRVLEGALRCIEDEGLSATTVEDVARAASVSRATIYRHFPGGREQLVSETVTWEVARFFARVEQAVATEPDLAARLRLALASGHRALDEHALLHRLLRTEPEAVMTELSVATDLVLELIVAYLADQLRAEQAAGRARSDLDLAEAADHLGRLYLSYLGAPGRWDLDDPGEIDRLVRTQFLGGVTDSTPADGSPTTQLP